MVTLETRIYASVQIYELLFIYEISQNHWWTTNGIMKFLNIVKDLNRQKSVCQSTLHVR